MVRRSTLLMAGALALLVPLAAQADPVSYWAFEDGTGSATAANAISGSPVATLRNMDPNTDWVAGRFGTGLDFDGTNQSLNVFQNISETANTISMWVKTAADGGLSSVNNPEQGGENDRNVYLSGGNVYGRVWNRGVINTSLSGLNFADGDWHHVVHQYGTTANHAIYVDGVLRATGGMYPSDFNWQTNLQFAWTNGQPYLVGQMDDIAIWDEVLSANQVYALANGVLPTNLPAATNSIVKWDVAGPSDWHTNTNWDPTTVPTTGNDAYINNGGTAQLTTGTADPSSLVIGGLGAGTLDWTGGALSSPSITVSTDGVLNSAVEVNLDNTMLTVQDNGQVSVGSVGSGKIMRVGNAGTASVVQTGGSVAVNDSFLVIGQRVGANGTYSISGGTLQTAANIYLGWDANTTEGTLNVSGTALVDIGGLLEGAGRGQGTVNQTGGTVAVNQHVVLGRYNGCVSTYNLSDGVLKTDGTSGNVRFHMSWNDAGSQSFLNLSGNGQIIVNENNISGYTGFLIGNQGTAEVNLSGNGSITVYGGGDGEGAMSLGLNGNASGTVNQTGGTVSLYDNFLMIGRRSTATGTYDLSGGTLTQSGSGDQNTYLGWDHATARGTLNVRGTGTANLGGNLYVGGNGTGEVTVDDSGSLNVPGAIYLGLNAGSTGTVNQSGGDVVVMGADGEGTGLTVGYNNSNGTYDLSGGSVTLSYGLTVGSRAGTVGNMTMSGGTLLTDFWVLVGRHGGTGTLTLSGDAEMTATLVRNNGRTHLGWDGGHGTLHLDGGTLTTSQIVKGTGTGTLYWNGGTVKVLPMPGAWGGFVESLDAAYIQAGGAILDTNGNNATIAQPLLHDPALGGTPDGGLNKNGAGVFYLDGANTYTGPTTVNGGYLVARNNAALGTAAGGVLVNSGGTLQLQHTSGITITGETATLNGTGVGGTRGALASWSGDNTWAGDVVLASDSSVYVYQHTLDIDGAISGSSTLTKTGGGWLYFSGSSSNTNTGTTAVGEGVLVLNKTGGAYAISGPVQMGTGSGSPHLRTYQPNQFAPGVVMVGANPWGQWARFDLLGNDQTLAGISGETGGLVIQNGGVGVAAPSDATLTVNGDADSYFGGHMRDTDGTGGYTLGLVKDGTGTLTLAGSVITYTGPTTVTGGKLIFSNTTALGAGTINNSATVAFLANGNTGYGVPGRLSGGGTYEVDGPGGGNQYQNRVILRGDGADNTGTINVINSGKLWLDRGVDAIGDSAIVNVGPSGSFFLYSAAGSDGYGTFQVAETIGGLAGSGNVYGHWVNGAIAPVLTVGGGNVSSTFNGTISEYPGTAAGLQLVKTGTGTQTLGGVNTYGGTTTIAGGTLKLQAPATTAPGSIGGLLVHLDANNVTGAGNPADGTQIGTWTNLASGGAGDFTGGTSPYVNWTGNPMNGNSVVHFWGGLLTNPTNFGNDVTVMYTGRMDGGANARLLSGVANNWLLGYWGGNMNTDWWNNGGVLSGALDYNSHIFMATANGTTAWAYNIDGTEVLFDGPRALGGAAQGPNGLSLGGGGSELSYADIGELLVFNRALSSAERLQMEQYLQAKWYGVLPATTAVNITASGATLDLNGVNQTIGSLAGVDSSQVLLNGGWLTIGQNQTGTTFSGAIGDGSTAGGGLSKVGTGTLTLAGTSANTYTGPTVISQGQIALSKTAGVTAIPGDILMLNSLSPTVWATADNQLGGNGVLSFANEVNTLPGYARFNLRGTTQSVAGIVETDAYRAGVIQNSETTGGAPADTGTSTLVLTGSGDYSFNGYLRNGTYGVLSLSKTGSGTQTLVGDRITYTGDTTVAGGTLRLTNTAGFNSPITINPAGTLVVDSTVPFATRWNYGQTLSGGGTFIKTGTGVFGLVGPVNLSGQILVQEGTLHNDNLTANWAGSTADVDISPGAILDLRGDHVTIDSLTGAGTVTNSYGHGMNVLTVGVANGSGAFSGPIGGSGNGSGEGQGLTSLVKEGTGAQTLSGNNTYGGTTTVNAGTLLLNGQHTGGGQYTVAAGATLGGTGTTTSPVDLSGALAPGASVGTLNTGSQTWNDGGSFLFEINDVDAGPGTGWDLLNVTGSLDLTGLSNGGFEIDVASLGLDDLPGLVHDFNAGLPYEWEFVRTSDGIAGFQERDFVIDAGAFANPLSNIGSFIVYQKGDSLYLGHHVPEPSTLVLAALGLLGLGLAGWRRPRRS